MESIFKRHFWVAQLGIIVAAAFLLAGAVNGFAASKFARFAVTYPDRPAPTLAEGDNSDQLELTIDDRTFGVDEEPEVVNTGSIAATETGDDIGLRENVLGSLASVATQLVGAAGAAPAEQHNARRLEPGGTSTTAQARLKRPPKGRPGTRRGLAQAAARR